MANEHYQEFIKEAFVDSIRSVLIVDDDYPTFEEVLGTQQDENNKNKYAHKAWYRNPDRIRGVIEKFRNNNPPLLVDIHDGTNVDPEHEKTLAKHLHQSDLLVLDYQLERLREEDGTRAIEILRKLMLNNHFNLVIVYTDQGLDVVFNDVRWGLLRPYSIPLCREEERAMNLIEEAEDDNQGFSKKIRNSIGNEQYFHWRLKTSTSLSTVNTDEQLYSKFYSLCDEVHWTHEERDLVFRYLLDKLEADHLSIMNADSSNEGLRWSIGPVKWIRGESIFICFSNKHDDDNLLSEVQSALNDWNPNPSRLFLAKIRAAMDEHGVAAQSQILAHRHALAYWYKRLLKAKADESELLWNVTETISHHSDQLMEAILPSVENFAIRLIQKEEVEGSIRKRCQEHFKVDLTNKESKTRAILEHNAFVCSKNPEGWHLTTGHVFKMCEQYWLCLSPACDLVPRFSAEQEETIDNRIPFNAVRLEPVEKPPKNLNFNSNRYLFLQPNEDVEIYCYNHPDGENSAPDWKLLYADNAGVFKKGSFQFKVWQYQKGIRKPIFKACTATVISQLRYEYALNLTQKLGVSLTRIGLDFTSAKRLDEGK